MSPSSHSSYSARITDKHNYSQHTQAGLLCSSSLLSSGANHVLLWLGLYIVSKFFITDLEGEKVLIVVLLLWGLSHKTQMWWMDDWSLRNSALRNRLPLLFSRAWGLPKPCPSFPHSILCSSSHLPQHFVFTFSLKIVSKASLQDIDYTDNAFLFWT